MREAVLDYSPIGVNPSGLKNYEALITEPIDRQIDRSDLNGPISYLVGPEKPKIYEPFKSPLDKRGFCIQLEINGLIADYREARSDGKTSREALLLSFSEREKNIRTYLLEYPGEGVVLPNLVDIAAVKGKQRMVNSYNHKAIIPRISPAERNGATLRASEQVEQFLVQAEPGSVAVITSPIGWTGFKGVDYGDTQTLIYRKKDDGGLEGVTIVSDLTLEQNKRLLIELGVDAAKLDGKSESEIIAKVVENPALVSPFLGKSLTLEDVASKILDIRGDRDITLHLPSGINRRSTVDMMSNIKKGDKLLEFDPEVEAIIKSFKEFVFEQEEYIEGESVLLNIAQSMEDTLLGASEIIMQQAHPNKEVKTHSTYVPIRQRPQDRERIIDELAKLPGCASGFTSTSVRAILRGSTYNIPSTGIGLESEKCSKCFQRKETVCGVCNDCAE